MGQLVGKVGHHKFVETFRREELGRTRGQRALGRFLEDALHASVVSRTWDTCRSCYCHIKAYRALVGEHSLTFPWSPQDYLQFSAYLRGKGLAAASISTYMGCLDTLHMSLGIEAQRPRMLTKFLRGFTNLDKVERQRPTRQEVSLSLLLKLREDVQGLQLPTSMEDMVLLVFSWQWFACLRVSELTCQAPNSFCRQSTLLQQDIVLKPLPSDPRKMFLLITVKGAKTNLGKATVELLPNETAMCPVSTYLKARRSLSGVPTDPLVTLPDGTFLTPKMVNSVLKQVADPEAEPGKIVRSHSLRMGLPTQMAAKGFHEGDIKIAGRWSGDGSWQRYCKKGRGLQIGRQEEIFKRLLEE